ncbi:hypothetical protein D9619_003619 [Psilocybe cf. subviscida]|uniref:F-box domain-containing protein n=1 Tax=Psilocybe cf. subviscida TaxID=2480587 RepID=A0A8H5AVP2_9AGAR|nr:hypothetical protein D9619_003619 [Psilocybe cf. subviscida]
MHDDDNSSKQTIAQLPTELMCRIFLFVRWAYETDSGLIPYSKACLQWIKACSHVSQHWRRIAVNYPMLWTNPPLHLPTLTGVMLQRSGTASLSFTLDLDYTLTSVIRTVTERGPWVRSLEIWCSRPRRFRTFVNALPANLTILEELFINHGRRPYPNSRSGFDDDGRKVHISDGQLFPLLALRKIILNHVNISWNSQIFGATVTTLSIVNVSRSAQFNVEEFRSMLGCMPNLTDLCISNACRLGETSMNGRRGVCLAKLNTIYVGSSPDEIGFVFNNIETSSTLASVILFFDNSDNVNPASIDLQLNRPLATLSHPCWTRGIGQGTGVVSFSQGAINDGDYDFAMSLSSQPAPFSFAVSIKPGLHDHEQVLAKNRYIMEVLFGQLHCSNLYAMSLNANLDIPSDTLATTLGTLQHLTVVYVCGPCAHSLLEALHWGYNGTNIFSTSDYVPFPALQYLRLTNHTFDDWLDRSPMSLEELRMCLGRRRAWDVAINTLHLENCYHKVPGELFERRELLPEEVTSLGDLVDNIDWDYEDI